jgi:hypothetical protein
MQAIFLSLTQEQKDRFWSKTIPEPNSGCLLWTAGCFGTGYGAFSIKSINYCAHQVAFTISGGIITDDKPHVLHSCNTRQCVNPAHLRAGSQQDNVDDAIRNGNHGLALTAYPRIRAKGSQHGLAKLNEDQVRAIRSEHIPWHVTAKQLSSKYGVSVPQIKAILSRKLWRHV